MIGIPYQDVPGFIGPRLFGDAEALPLAEALCCELAELLALMHHPATSDSAYDELDAAYEHVLAAVDDLRDARARLEELS